jgi:lia operon protein LiaH
MSALKRMERFIKASIHEGLDRIENPEMMIKQHLRDVKASIKKAEQNIQKQRYVRETLDRDKQMTERLITRREQQAVEALKAAEESLAKKVLVDKKHLEQQLIRYDQLTEKSTEVKHHFEVELEKLKDQHKQLREKKIELSLRLQGTKTGEHMKALKPRSYTLDLEEEFVHLDDQVIRSEEKAYKYSSQTSKNLQEEHEIEVEAELRLLKEKLDKQS